MFEFLAVLFVVSLVSSLAKAAVGTGAQTIQMNQQANLNSNLMDKQAGLNRDQYDYEYSKESPASRVSQYIAANLNPGLMYSNGVAGMQGSVGSVNGSSVGLPNFSNLFNLEESVNALDKLGLTEPSKARMDLNKSYKELTDNQSLGQELANKWQEYENSWKKVDSDIKSQYAPKIAEIDLKTRREQFDKLCAETISIMNDNSMIEDKRKQLKNALDIQVQQLLNMQAEKVLLDNRSKLTEQQYESLKQRLPHEINLLMENYNLRIQDTLGQTISNEYYQKVLADYNATWWNNVFSAYLKGIPLGTAINMLITKKPK